MLMGYVVWTAVVMGGSRRQAGGRVARVLLQGGK